MSVADVFDAAADLIEPEGAWCQWAWAKDAQGNEVCDHDPAAVCFCAVGALNRAVGIQAGDSPGDHPFFSATREMFASVNGERPMAFNDAHGRTQAEVVQALRDAATKARTESSR